MLVSLGVHSAYYSHGTLGLERALVEHQILQELLGSCPGGFIIQWGKEMKSIQQKESNNEEFLWDILGVQKNLSVSDSACGSSVRPCLIFGVLSFLKILQMESIYTKHHVI